MADVVTPNMPSRTPIFLTGATGYIGGSVLQCLLEHPSASTFNITLLVRNAAKGDILRSTYGVDVVVGNHQELGKLESLARNAHVVFHTADADDEPAVRAILAGLRKRHAELGDLPILIHTSGTAVLSDTAKRGDGTETIYSDLNVEQLKAIPPTALHRNVDLLVIEADAQGYARTHIIFPSTVYSIAQGPLFDAGISNPHSMQIPYLIRAALGRKRAGIVGEGNVLRPNVHILDVADLYITLFDAIVRDPAHTGHGWEGLYFGANDGHDWDQVARAIGQALVELGVCDDPAPTAFTNAELVRYFGSNAASWFNTSGARARADRSRSIGWKPRYTVEDMLKSIKPEVVAIMREREASKA
ncbi:NAD-P-binding protein [Trametes elegans]|nr:NAD-P-binding protein [Trametes elegans]